MVLAYTFYHTRHFSLCHFANHHLDFVSFYVAPPPLSPISFACKKNPQNILYFHLQTHLFIWPDSSDQPAPKCILHKVNIKNYRSYISLSSENVLLSKENDHSKSVTSGKIVCHQNTIYFNSFTWFSQPLRFAHYMSVSYFCTNLNAAR